MKITKTQLREIIREELNEYVGAGDRKRVIKQLKSSIKTFEKLAKKTESDVRGDIFYEIGILTWVLKSIESWKSPK